MQSQTLQIEALLHRLEPKYLEYLKVYVEYLIMTQQNEKTMSRDKVYPAKSDNTKLSRLEVLRQFKGDPLFPVIPVSKYDVYI
jgi:hypothetical protein